MCAKFKRLWSAQNGSIAVMGVMALSSILGMSGLAVEVGNGYAAKIRNQRVTDLAALGAAVAYKSSGLASDPATVAATAVAKDIVRANGISDDPSVTQVAKVDVNGSPALQVTVKTSVPIRLARMFSSAASYDVRNTAIASLSTTTTSTTTTGGGGCMSSMNGISASGGASITANNCNIAANGTITSDNGSAKISGKAIAAKAISDAAASYGQNAITTTTTNGITLQSNAASDFIKDTNPAVKDALCQVNKLTGSTDTYNATSNPYGYVGGNTNCTSLLATVPTLTNSSTTDWSTNYSPKTTSGFNLYTNGSCNYTVPMGTYNIRDLTIGGGCTVTFQTGSTLNFRNLNMTGADLSFGDGDITISGTFNVSANNTVTMGNGAHSFGTLTIGGGKSLTVGTGNLVVVNGISVGGGAFLKVNITTGNTVILGKDSSSNSIAVSGGSKVCFTSDCTMATAAAGIFSATGNVNVQGGGSLVAFPKSVNHIINGDLIATAGILFGPGLYIIKGNFQNTTGSGNDSMNGIDVTFAMGGTFNFAGGSKFDLAAPSTSTGGYGIQDILFATKSTGASVLNAGASGKASGTLYLPNSAFSATGGTSISNKGSGCMTLLVNSITATGSGTITTANCTSVTSGSTTTTTSTIGTVSLIQ